MKKIALILFASCVALFSNCQTNKSTTTSSNGEKMEIWRLCIAFTSHSAGIDGAKYETIENYIKAHPKKPAFEVVAQGREGEREIRMQLKEFSKSEATTFVNEVKKQAEGSDRVLITENSERVKKQ